MTNRWIDLRMVHLSCDRSFAAAAFAAVRGEIDRRGRPSSSGAMIYWLYATNW